MVSSIWYFIDYLVKYEGTIVRCFVHSLTGKHTENGTFHIVVLRQLDRYLRRNIGTHPRIDSLINKQSLSSDVSGKTFAMIRGHFIT